MYDLELYTLAEHKMEFFFQQNAASINRVMSKGAATNPAGLKKETKEELQCCVKATIIWEQNLAKIESFRFLKQQPNALAKLICATE